MDFEADDYDGLAGIKADESALKVIRLVKSRPLTKESILAAGVSEKELDDAVKSCYVDMWSAFLDKPVYYVHGEASEWKTEQFVEAWMDSKQFTEIMFNAINNMDIFAASPQNMLEFLQSFEKGRLRFWTPITFYETLSSLYENGRLKETALAPLLGVIEEAKRMPVDELDVDLADAKKLVKLNLLTVIDKEAGLYKYGYCSFLESYFLENGVDYVVLLNEELEKLGPKQLKFLKQLDIVEGGKLTSKGKMVTEYLCQCGFDPTDRTNELKRLVKEWKERSAKERDALMSARYLLKSARLEKKLKMPEADETIKEATKAFSERLADTPYVVELLDDAKSYAQLYAKATGGGETGGRKAKQKAKMQAAIRLINAEKEFTKQGAHALSGAMHALFAQREFYDIFDAADKTSYGIPAPEQCYRLAAKDFYNAGKVNAMIGMLGTLGFFSEEEMGMLKEASEKGISERAKKIIDHTYSEETLAEMAEQSAKRAKALQSAGPDTSYKKSGPWKGWKDEYEAVETVREAVSSFKKIAPNYARTVPEAGPGMDVDGLLKGENYKVIVDAANKLRSGKVADLSEKELYVVQNATWLSDELRKKMNSLKGRMDRMEEKVENDHRNEVYDAKRKAEIAKAALKGIKEKNAKYAVVDGLEYL
ncbi:MAG: hypothetical protein QXD77_01295 [Candidatus Aenigmatarchaeota archaeon]